MTDVSPLMQRKLYRVAGQRIAVEVEDDWSAAAVEKLFAGWYLAPEFAGDEATTRAIVVRSTIPPPKVPSNWRRFEIAGGGVCSSEGNASYIEIEGSVIAIDIPGLADVEVWANGPFDIRSDAWTRILTYALAAALRRRGLFELHSGAVVEPETRKGILIIGPSGSGKSTLTVQLATAGWPFLTDDVLVLRREADDITAWPLRRSFAITSQTLESSSYLQANCSLAGSQFERDDKRQFIPHEVFGSEFKENCTPATLFFTRLSGLESSSATVLTPGETMTRLIRMNPWSCYDQGTAAEHLAVLSTLVRQSRGYELLAGKDLLRPELAARLIASYART